MAKTRRKSDVRAFPCENCRYADVCGYADRQDGSRNGFDCYDERIIPRTGRARGILILWSINLLLAGATLYKHVLWRWF